MKYEAIIFVLLVTAKLISQDLYFVKGHPLPAYAKEFPTTLYRISENESNFIKVRGLSEGNFLTDAIFSNYNDRIFANIEQDLYGTKHYTINIISMNKPEVKKEIIISNYSEYTYTRGDFVKIDNTVYLIMKLASSRMNPRRILVGINIETLEIKLFDPSVYKNIVVFGSKGNGLYDGYYYILHLNDDGTLTIPESENKSNEIIYGEIDKKNLNEIKEKQKSNNNLFVLAIKDDNKTVYSYKNTEKGDSKGILYSIKGDDNWRFHQFEGDITSIFSIDNWIIGRVGMKNRDMKLINPIKVSRNPKLKEIGVNPDYRLRDLYYPGILFLFNLENEKYYEIITNDADSEILLIENNVVYYRIYDEIYKSEIIGDKVSEGILLVKDNIVPDIHWAFISK